MSTQIYVFDCDGVIIDSGEDIAACVNHTLNYFGYWTLPENQLISFLGDGARELILRALKASTKNKFNIESENRKAEFEKVLSYYVDYYAANPINKTSLYAGIKELLRVLSKKEKNIVLLTNKPEKIARIILEKLDVLSYFDLIIAPDTKDENGSFIEKKPSTQGLEYALRQINLKSGKTFTKDNVIFFGDSASDIICGKSFGCKTVACRGGLGNREELLAQNADLCFSVASEIEKFIDILSSDQDISQIKDYAMKYEVPIMQDEGSDFICDYIKENGLKSVLEIGTAIGYSSVRFANLDPEIKVTTIEIDPDRYQAAVKNVKEKGLENQITLILGDALTTQIQGKFDLIFIDAAKAQYIKFFEKFKENLSERGVIISDNLSFHGMVEDLSLTHNYSTKKLVKKIRKYIDFLKENSEFDTQFIKKGDGISVSRRKSN
ncbi:MAG: HAD hydrolase-like protein [Treponema sp.]|nr:HAD hydrolase-like protein [Treponema sp.]